MILGIDEFGVLRVLVVQNLQFHAGAGGSALARVVNAEPVVAACRKKEFELEDVVGVLLFRDEVATFANDCPVLDYVSTTLPSGQILPVKEGNRFGRGQEKRTSKKKAKRNDLR